MATESRDRANAICLFISVHVAQRRFFDHICVGQLIGDKKRTRRQQGAFAILAAHTQEIVVGHAVRLINLAFIATLPQRLLRQGCGRAIAGNKDRVRISRHDLQDLARNRRITAGEPFIVDQAKLAQFREFGKLTKPALAIGIRKTDKRHSLDPAVGHVGSNRSAHLRIILRCLENPVTFGINRLNDGG